MKNHDFVACVFKTVKASHLHVAAYMTSTADAPCPENLSKLRQMSNFLLKQRRESVIAVDWNMVPDQLKTIGFLKLVGWLCY